MKEKISGFNEKCLMIYIVVFAFWSLVGRIIPVYMFIGIRVENYIYISLAIVGCMLIISDFFTEKYMFQTQYCKWLYLFIFALIISSLINMDRGYVDNIKTIIWTTIQIAVMYPVYLRIKKKRFEKLINIIFCGISIVWTIGVIYSIKQFVLSEAYNIELGADMMKRQGFQYGRLFGIFNDPNFAAVMSVYVIVMICYLVFAKKSIYKIIGWIAILFQQMYVILSGSRTALVCELVTGLFVIILVGRVSNKEDNQLKKGIKLLVLCIGFTCLLGIIVGGGKRFLEKVPILYNDSIVRMNEKYIESIQSDKSDMSDTFKMVCSLEDGERVYENRSVTLEIQCMVEEENEDEYEFQFIDVYNKKENIIQEYSSSKTCEILTQDIGEHILCGEVKKKTGEKQVLTTKIYVVPNDKAAYDVTQDKTVLADRKNEKNISNNRLEIWENYIRGMQGRYLCGLSPRNMLSYYKEKGTSPYLIATNYETHNGYVSLFVGTGIIGTFFIACFIILTIKRLFKSCFTMNRVDGKYLCLLSILCIIVIYSFFFTELFFVNNLTTVLFWVILGKILCDKEMAE